MDKWKLDITVDMLMDGKRMQFTQRAIDEHEIQHHVFALIDFNRKLQEYSNGKCKVININIE